MREWVRLTVPMRCGGCGASVEKGASMQRLTLTNVKRKLYRCEACVGSEAPPALPVSLMKQEDWTKRMQALASVAVSFPQPAPKPVLVPRKRAYRGEPDVKMRQTGMYDDFPRYDR